MQIIPHDPTSEEGRRALAERTAAAQAAFVCEQLKRLNCPKEQKLQLLAATLTASETGDG